jgi:hypothetical protein
MIITASIVVCVLLGLAMLFAAVRRLRQRRVFGAFTSGASALVLFLAAVCIFLIGANLRTYQRLTLEQPAGELQFSRAGSQTFNAVLTYPDGQNAYFLLRGDEWQIDARVLKWHAFANLLGFDAAYRLERVSGRYSKIEDERTAPHTVYELNATGRIDPWDLVHRYRSWIPWVDALYGSATFLPMADGALYEIEVSQSGLLGRPLNHAAREAIESWHQ